MDSNFWKNKKVLLTGHTGFKGSWLSIWLKKLGVELVGFSKDIPTKPSLYEVAKVSEGMISITGNIEDFVMIQKVVKENKPEIVIHMAAQSLVRKSYEEPITTFATNVMGTVNLLQAIKTTGNTRVLINVTVISVMRIRVQKKPFLKIHLWGDMIHIVVVKDVQN